MIKNVPVTAVTVNYGWCRSLSCTRTYLGDVSHAIDAIRLRRVGIHKKEHQWEVYYVGKLAEFPNLLHYPRYGPATACEKTLHVHVDEGGTRNLDAINSMTSDPTGMSSALRSAAQCCAHLIVFPTPEFKHSHCHYDTVGFEVFSTEYPAMIDA
jgi:hypothetical protein